MKLITKNSDYALRALACLAQNPDRVMPSAAIAEKEHIPLRYLRRILNVLLKRRLIMAREGAAGGVMLARAAVTITVAEVIEAMQGAIQLSECMFRKKICANRGRCVLRTRIASIERTVIEQFAAITIADIAGET